jgi:hypothetical protein
MELPSQRTFKSLFFPIPNSQFPISLIADCSKSPTQNRYDYDIVVTVRKLSSFVNMSKVVTTLLATCSQRIRQKI